MKDCFLYNGTIWRGYDLSFMEFVLENKGEKHEEVMLILSTHGGEPSAAYKIGRYLQFKYSNVEIFLPGPCKSAGTLLAISANKLIFSPYGELGPLDIQIVKTDKIVGFESGLNIDVAFKTLEERATAMFHNLALEIIAGSKGVISYQTASHSASQIISSLFGPIFSRIDPEEVGSRARALQICTDYGRRLNSRFLNLRDDPNALGVLSGQYPSHDFVIDIHDAKLLFHRVREASDSERELIKSIDTEKGVGACRIPKIGEPLMMNLTDNFQKIETETKTKTESRSKK